VIVFEPAVFTKRKIEHLPMDIVIRVGKLLHDSYARNNYSLICLAMTCGIFTNPKQENQTILLPWSPLRTNTATAPDESSFENLLDMAKDFIQDKFSAALTHFHESAYSLMKTEFPPTCFQQLYKGKQYPLMLLVRTSNNFNQDIVQSLKPKNAPGAMRSLLLN
jgi:hypothetical protein